MIETKGRGRPRNKERREGQINLRVTETERALIERAAEAQKRSMSNFVLAAALNEAERICR